MRNLSLLILVVLFHVQASGCQKHDSTESPPEPSGVVIKLAQGTGVPNPQAKEQPAPKGGVARSMQIADVRNYMKQLGIAYSTFEATNNRGPRNLDELAPYFERNGKMMEALKKGSWVFFYNVNRPQLTANAILAYEAHADSNGARVVVLGDGSVQTLDESTFKATPKAR